MTGLASSRSLCALLSSQNLDDLPLQSVSALPCSRLSESSPLPVHHPGDARALRSRCDARPNGKWRSPRQAASSQFDRPGRPRPLLHRACGSAATHLGKWVWQRILVSCVVSSSPAHPIAREIRDPGLSRSRRLIRTRARSAKFRAWAPAKGIPSLEFGSCRSNFLAITQVGIS